MASLKQTRTALGLTQKQLCGYLEIPRSMIISIEGGKRKPAKAVLKKLRVLNTTIEKAGPVTKTQRWHYLTEQEKNELREYLRKTGKKKCVFANKLKVRLDLLKTMYQNCQINYKSITMVTNGPGYSKEAIDYECWQLGLKTEIDEMFELCDLEKQYELEVKFAAENCGCRLAGRRNQKFQPN